MGYYAGPESFYEIGYNMVADNRSPNGCGKVALKLLGIIVFLALIGIAIAALWL